MKENKDAFEELSALLESIKVTKENIDIITEAQNYIQAGEYETALDILKGEEDSEKKSKKKDNKEGEKEEETVQIYPKELAGEELEERYIGMLLKDLKSIVKFYIVFDECYFANPILLEIYKMILFTDGEKYAPAVAKNKFNFANITYEVNSLKSSLKKKYTYKNYDMEKIYIELRKLFALRKNYLEMPIRDIQNKIVDIVNYKLYDKMSVEEVEAAVNQIKATERFKQSILNDNLTEFLISKDNNLTNGIELPFPILSNVFKGARKGETMAFAMPSNAGKSRFTLNLAATVAFVKKKKVLIISNEMTEDKMRLCLITTILNNERFAKLHKQKIKKREDEILDFKFRPDKGVKANLDEKGFIMKENGETQRDFVKRLKTISSEFNKVLKAIDWVNKEIDNSIYFANITDHTNDELKKIIMNYYYKEEIEYIFYDTLKNDTEHIGSSEEVKKTATILSNLAQKFDMFIFSTLQLTESSTLPVNLNINDLSASRTVKEILDTLCLCKQIHNEHLGEYEYSLNEVDTKFFELEKFEDPDVRYYACVVDKNRAGAKPKVLFRLNLAYNFWEELGYLRLKQID